MSMCDHVTRYEKALQILFINTKYNLEVAIVFVRTVSQQGKQMLACN